MKETRCITTYLTAKVMESGILSSLVFINN